MSDVSQIGRHLTLLDGGFRPGGGQDQVTAARRLRKVVLREYVDKLPAFVSVDLFASICGLSMTELAEAAEDGRIQVTRRNGRAGLVINENIAFMRSCSLIRLPVPEALREENVIPLLQVRISRAAFEELAHRADAEGVSIADVVDRLLCP